MNDVTFHADLNPAELGTVRLALIAWRSRAEREAAVMEKFGASDTLDRARAAANARASRTFVHEADELLAKLEPGVIRSTVSPERLAALAAELMADDADQELADVIHRHDCEDALEPTVDRDPFAAGGILYASWGYDQTNVDFYRVESRSSGFVLLQQLESEEASDDTADRPATMTGRVMPKRPHQAIGEPIRRKLHANGDSPFVKINNYTFAYAWDGTPKRVSHYA